MAFTKTQQTELDFLNKQAKYLAEYNSNINNFDNVQLQHEAKMEAFAVRKRVQELEFLKLRQSGGQISQQQLETYNENNRALEKEIALEKKSIENKGKILELLTKNYWYQTGIFKVLNDQDKIIRQTILNLGMSGVKALEMRKSFENAAADAALLGANLEDITKIQTGFADETGRAQALTNNMVQDVILIGKGTGMGVEQATKLASQFQIMGVDTRSTMEYVQGIVDTSERMGINTTKVLNNIANNFKKLQTMNFNTGVQGYAKMAEYAEQMKMDMAESIQSNKMANNLEKAIDLGAQLQVMGGEFAKLDPFQMLYLSRNAPEELAKRLNEMTKGLVTFQKMADGTFQHFMSPADRDRLEYVAKATNKSIESLTEEANRMADVTRMKQMMLGTGFSAEDKELITGQAVFNTKLGNYLIKVGETRKDISQLTAEDVKALQIQKTTLAQRATDALTFNESLQSMVDALKTTLIPLMRGMTTILTPIRSIASWLSHTSDGFKEFLGGFGKVLGVVLIAQGVVTLTKTIVNSIKSTLGVISALKGASSLGGNPIQPPTGGGPNAGMGMMHGGIGIGAATLGAGVGIGIAAGGISILANAMSKLDKEKAEILKDIITSISWVSGIAMAATTAIAVWGNVSAEAIGAVGGALTAGAVGFLTFGGAILLAGKGIDLAASGIGRMAEGFSKLVESSKGADMGLAKVAVGIAAVNVAMGVSGLFGTIGSIFGGNSGLEKTLDNIASKADKISLVGNAFKEINTVLNGSKDDFAAVESAINAISNMNTSKGSAFAQLADLLTKPIQVEFTDKKVAIVSNITLEIDGEKLMEKAYKSDRRVQRDMEAQMKLLDH